jgi:ribosome-binding factor A
LTRSAAAVSLASSIVDESSGHRHARLQLLLQRELEELLRDEVGDPRLDRVRVVGVVLSVDYRHARVHYTIAGSDDVRPDRQRVARALENASPFLRARLADAVELKRVPDLRFVFDAEAVD